MLQCFCNRHISRFLNHPVYPQALLWVADEEGDRHAASDPRVKEDLKKKKWNLLKAIYLCIIYSFCILRLQKHTTLLPCSHSLSHSTELALLLRGTYDLPVLNEVTQSMHASSHQSPVYLPWRGSVESEVK